MNRRTAFAIAAASITTLGTGVVTAAAMSGSDGPRVEVVASSKTTDDNSPTSTRQSERAASDHTSTTRTTAPTTRSTDDRSNSSTSTTTRSTTSPTGVSPTSNTATFRSLGGEVDVTWTARTLTIVAVRPAAGFRTEREEQDGDEVEAEFESGAHDSKITVRLVNGSPSASVRERDDDERVGDDDRADDRSGHDDGADASDNSGHGSEREDDHGGGSGRG
jgi:hypothetical protein